MLWLYVLFLTAGLVITVPAVVQAIDHQLREPVLGTVGFAALIAGAVGIVLLQFDSISGIAVLVASLAIGLAVGVIHPEILNLVSEPPEDDPSIGDTIEAAP